MEQYVAQGWLNVRVAFSRDDAQAQFATNGGGGEFVFSPGKRGYVDQEMLQEENARILWELLRSRQDGGLGAYFYVCGRTSFANTVMDAIKEIIYRFSEGTEQEKEQNARNVLYRLAGEERYLQEIFTTYTGSQIEKQVLFDASEVCIHNNPQDGYWMIINGRVYDVTEFTQLHPGGVKIITGYAGMDATVAYQSVLHHENSEVDAMLGMYEIGAVRRLSFGMIWGVAIGPKGLQFVSLSNMFRAWVRLLYYAVEMQNALDNDYTIRSQALTRGENPMDDSPFKAQMLVEVHQRFMLNYLSGAMGEPLSNLWAVTSGLCDPSTDVRWMSQVIESLRQTEEAQTVERLGDELARGLTDLVEREGTPDDTSMKIMVAYCELLEEENKRFLNEMKLALREGVRVFEEYERATIDQGSARLLEAIRKMPSMLEAYYTRVFAGIQTIERQSG
jgi:sulfite reductase (NADPH) flavoprotein alpha-component